MNKNVKYNLILAFVMSIAFSSVKIVQVVIEEKAGFPINDILIASLVVVLFYFIFFFLGYTILDLIAYLIKKVFHE